MMNDTVKNIIARTARVLGVTEEEVVRRARISGAALDLLAALRPFVAAYRRIENPGTADLVDEQPVCVYVSLGDCRRAQAALRKAEGE